MLNTGWVICGTGANDASEGTVAWVNPTNIQANDASDATASITSLGVSQYLKATNFNFAAAGLKSGDAIRGIEVQIERGQSTTDVQDTTIRQVDHTGTIVGDNKSATASWGTYPDVVEFGGAADLWGLTPSADEVLNSNWGVVFLATQSVPLTSNIQVDFIKMKITYIKMANSFGEKGISKRYPVPSSSGVGIDDYHEDRKIFLEPENCSKVSRKVKETL